MIWPKIADLVTGRCVLIVPCDPTVAGPEGNPEVSTTEARAGADLTDGLPSISENADRGSPLYDGQETQ